MRLATRNWDICIIIYALWPPTRKQVRCTKRCLGGYREGRGWGWRGCGGEGDKKVGEWKFVRGVGGYRGDNGG